MKYKIALITLCYNESKIMPWVIDYWKKFVTHAYVFDNGSTDNSREILSQYDWITVIDYSHLTGNKLNDTINMNIKNHFYKTIKNEYDFVVIVDFDECLYCEDWEKHLTILFNAGICGIIPNYHNVITYDFPEYIEGKLFHEVNEYERSVSPQEQAHFFQKTMLFNCKWTHEINFCQGSHRCNIITLKGNSINKENSIPVNSIHCIHLLNIGLNHIVEKYDHNKRERMSEENLKRKFGVQYLKERQTVIDEYEKEWKHRKKMTI